MRARSFNITPGRWVACFAILGLVGSGARAAAAFDCAVLRDSTIPFEIALERKITMGEQEPLKVQGHLQIFRKDAGATSYQFFTADAWFRAHYTISGFPDAFFTSKEATNVRLEYVPTPTEHMFEVGRQLKFHVTMTRHDGEVIGEQDHDITFADHRSVELGGCSFDVINGLRKIADTVNGKYSESQTEFWFSPALRTSLYVKTEMANQPSQSYTALDISLEFKPVE